MTSPNIPDSVAEQALRRQMPNVEAMLGQEPEALARYAKEELARKERLEQLLASGAGLPEANAVLRDEHYFCTVDVAFIVCYGTVTASVNFGDGYTWDFKSSFWGGGACGGKGAGWSPWGSGFIAPNEGETMWFQIQSVQATAGEIQMFFWRANQPILGGILVAAAGVGAFGGGGSGAWHRGTKWR